MAFLVLVRHGKSEWNHKGLWTGLTDVDLVEEGKAEAARAGEKLSDISFHRAFTSVLKRTHQTFEEIKNVLGLHTIPVTHHHALNERDYGVHTGKNKWQVKEEVGEEIFQKIRRSWDHPIPEGESLRQVFERTVPYYTESIEVHLKNGENVLIVAHGNTLRALMKHIESISDEGIASVEIETGHMVVYELDSDGAVIKKETRSTKE